MTPANGVKASKSIFWFHLIGFQRNLMYNGHTQELYMADIDGLYMYSVRLNVEMTYEEFDMRARDFWLTLLEQNS